MKKNIKIMASALAIAGLIVNSTVANTFAKEKIDGNLSFNTSSESLAVRYRSSFKGYKGSGQIYVKANGVWSADLYVNGNLVDISQAIKNNEAVIDISKYTIDGDNNIKVLNVLPRNSMLEVKVLAPKVTNGEPEENGFSTEKLKDLDNFIGSETMGINPITGENYISTGVLKGEFPGASIAIIKDGKLVKNAAYGHTKLWDKYEKVQNPEKVQLDTLFDLASNTKMYATNFALMKLVYEGKLNLDDKLQKYLPGYKDEPDAKFKGKDKITIRNLLHHNAGHAASVKFYDKDRAEGLFSVKKEETVKLFDKVPLTYEVGTQVLYSDTDYMILGYIVELITGEALDEYVEKNIYKPLGLTRTCFNPLQKGFKKEEIAATERNGNTRDGSITFEGVRDYVLQGEVHDEKAFYSMQGVSGHAGLFSTAKELAILCQVVLNGGSYGDVTVFDRETLDEFIKPSYSGADWGLGWNIQDGNRTRNWMFSPYTYNTIGHTGWTGTLTNIDFENDMIVVLLTNQRNSPCPEGNFESAKYETGRYGSITTLAYEALLENINSTIVSNFEGITESVDSKGSQTDPLFPDKSQSSRYHVNNKRGFYGFKGSGEIVVENQGATKAEIYINGNKIDISSILQENKKSQRIKIGKYTVDGVNALKVINIQPKEGKVNVRILYPEVMKLKAEDMKALSENFNSIDELINSEVKFGMEGAALSVVRNGKLIKSNFYGSTINNNTLLDLGNGTEIFSTNLAIAKLISDKLINYNDSIEKYLPGAIKDIKIKHLLEHTSGLPEKINSEANELLTREQELDKLTNLVTAFKPGSKVRYSEYDSILLGCIMEKVTGMTQDKYVEENIYKPLGLKNTLYNPIAKGYDKENIIAFNKDQFTINKLKGISGHYGLYSNINDLTVLSQVIINYGGYGGVRLFDKDTAARFISPLDITSAQGLGFVRQGDFKNIDLLGAYGNSKNVGWKSDTGISVVINPTEYTAAIYMANSSEKDKYISSKGENITTLVSEALKDSGKENNSTLLQLAIDTIEKNKNDNSQEAIKASSAILEIMISKIGSQNITKEKVIDLVNLMPESNEKISLKKQLGVETEEEKNTENPGESTDIGEGNNKNDSNQGTLPKTGSAIDNNTLKFIGLCFILAGGAITIKPKKRAI